VTPRLSTYICSRLFDRVRCSMGYLLSSVDTVLYCGTNGPTHAPTVLSRALSTGSVLASSLGPLRVVHFIVLLHRVVRCTVCALHTAVSVVVRFMHCALHHDLLPLYLALIHSGEQFNWPAVLTKPEYFNLLVRSCANTETNADQSREK